MEVKASPRSPLVVEIVGPLSGNERVIAMN